MMQETKKGSNETDSQPVDAKKGLENIQKPQACLRASIHPLHNNWLNWLTPVDYAHQQNDFISRRQAGTCQWFLDTAEFQQWLGSDKQTLFCPGIPGAGKTILTSVIVEELNLRFQTDPSIGIAYVYCSYQRQIEQTVEHLLLSLLKQLTIQQLTRKQIGISVPFIIRDLYNRHLDRQTRPWLPEISKALQLTVAKFSRTYIIVDGLDECQGSNGRGIKFLTELFSLQKKSQVNIIATSRFVPEIIDQFKSSICLEIRASNEDVQKYVEGHLEELPDFVQHNEPLQNEIKTRILGAADGMFLLAHLFLRSLDGKPTVESIKVALKGFQKQGQGSGDDEKMQVLAHAYDQTMERIGRQEPGFRELAKKTLLWIAFAKRPLSVSELQRAVTVDIGQSSLDSENLPQAQDIVSVCTGLATLDKESNIIRFAHYTVQEYFEQKQELWFPNAQADITNICLAYLSFDAFKTGYCLTDEEFEERLRLNALYDYASRNWGIHAYEDSAKAKTAVFHSILNFLQSGTKLLASSQAMMVSGKRPSYSQNTPKEMTGLHIAAYFGLEEAVKALQECGEQFDQKDSHGRTPLTYAAENGHEKVVKLLLATDEVDPNTKDNDNWTPLMRAAANGHEGIVKMLLATDEANADAKDRSGQTALMKAAGNGHVGVVKLLLAIDGVDPDVKDNRDSTPLIRAVEKGHEDVVKLLLATDRANPDAKVRIGGWTPLSWAAEIGHETIVKLLLDTNKVDPNADGRYGWTPLSWAAMNGHEAIIQQLLVKGAELESKDRYGQTALLLAVKNGYEAAVRVLLEKGANLEAKDGSGQTPMLLAAAQGYEMIVKLLLEKGANIESRDHRFDQTPLSWAARNGNVRAVQLLLEKGADPDSKDKNLRTPLSWAAGSGNAVVVQLFLEKSADLESKDEDNGRTPLSWAAESGNDATVHLLLEKGADLESKDKNFGRTPLSWAAQSGDEATLLLLLKNNADLESKDKDYRSPLSWAADGGSEVAVQLLLWKGANRDTKDKFGRSPLSYAAERGHKGVVKLLAEEGSDLETNDEAERSPLSYAAERGHEAVVKLLLEKGVELESKDKSHGRTPLSWAACNGHMAVVKLLLDNGADLESKDSECSRTPLLWAELHGHRKVVQLLLEKGANSYRNSSSPAPQPNKDDYYNWRNTVFGTPYMIWHDGLCVGEVTSLAGDEREVALRMLRRGVEFGDSYAAQALAAMGDKSALTEMWVQLRQSTGKSRIRFALAINSLSPNESLAKELVEELSLPSNWGDSMEAAIGLRNFGDPASERALLDAIEQKDDYLVRYHASQSLLWRWHVTPSDITEHSEIWELIRTPDKDVTTEDGRARLREAVVRLEKLRKQDS